jgi:hypothetical protein
VTGLRVALGLLALSAAAVGVPAAFVPHRFYADFPFLASWVDLLPPYNKHLITDVGEFYLAFAVLFTWAAFRPSRALVIPVCVAWAVAAALHLRFHVTHLGGFSTADAIAETVSLAVVLLLPFAALAALRQSSSRAADRPSGGDRA